MQMQLQDLFEDYNKNTTRVFLFDSTTSTNWEPSREHNLMFLRTQENWANDLLRARGHLFLNEVCDMLGIQRTGHGAVCGWFLEEGSKSVEFTLISATSTSPFLHIEVDIDGVIFNKI